MRKPNLNKYIDKVKKIHGLKYDYSKIFLNNWRDKIVVICSHHGEFKIRPDNFYVSGCQKCSIENFKKIMTLSTDDFIKKSISVHGNIYDYSETICKGTKKKTKIICPVHGIFKQRVDAHLNGSICPTCDKEIKANRLRNIVALKTFSFDETIQKSKEKHNHKYTYDINTEYKNTDSLLKIHCSIHGWFYQTATKHLGGQGCSKCGYILIGEKTKKNLKEFIKEANEKHKNFYDYSKSVYISAHKKILISCPKHGLFEQAPNSHLKGAGCKKCAYKILSLNQSLSLEEFIQRSNITHDYLYDYSKVKYKNGKSRVIINCNKHGEFKQIAATHLRGNGCPICSSSKGEKKVIKYLKKKNIDFIHQWLDHHCKPNTRRLVFDFMLPAERVIIEYDGEQHFKPKFKTKNFEKGIERLRQIQFNDSYKNMWAKENNYKMIRIKYNENIVVVLDKFL